jgi:hypothetical protein
MLTSSYQNVQQSSSVEKKLKEILIDIRLLQETCKNINEPWSRPRKYSELTLEQAQNEQRRLIPKMKELSIKLSDSELEAVVQESDKEAALTIELTSGAPNLYRAFGGR